MKKIDTQKSKKPTWKLAESSLQRTLREIYPRNKGLSLVKCMAFMSLTMAAPNILAQPPARDQLPSNGQVVTGQASISQSSTRIDITQSSDRAAIDWQSFSLGSNAQINFQQPASNSVILNRVTGSDPSQIFGQINANGQVFLSNPNGVTFAPGASVNVGGLVATTLDISNDDFMAGINTFTRGNTTASVVNEGTIRVANYVALLAPEVRNEGIILVQNKGTVALASGDVIELQINNSGRLLDIQVAASTVDALVSNGGAVHAPGGLIILSASAADALLNSVVRDDGSLNASSMVEKGGRILLEGDDIFLTNNSVITAQGVTGGGDVLVGGDWQGSGDMHQATRVTMEQGAKIDASAIENGDGGKVVLWSDVTNTDSVTIVKGEIVARGGAQSGDGGKIETSGYVIDTEGSYVNAGADNGVGGLWLIDPADVNINQGTANGYVNTLNNDTSVSTEVTGSITLLDNVLINKTTGGNATLTFKATDNIILGTGSQITSTFGELNVVLWGNADEGGGQMQVNSTITTNGGHLWMGGGNGSATWNGLAVGDSFMVPSNGSENGIGLTGTNINTTGGNLYMSGRSDTANVSRGVAIEGGTSISTGSGNIDITGTSFTTNSANGNSHFGIYVDNASINATSGNITLTGDVQGRYTNGVGLVLWAEAGDVRVESTTGDVTLTGSGTDSAGTGNGWRHGMILVSTGASDDITVKSTSGKITLDGAASFLNSADADTSGVQLQNDTTTSTINIVSQTGDIDIKGRNAEDSGTYNSAVRFTAQNIADNLNIGFDGVNAYSGNILIQGNRIYQLNVNAGSGSIRVQSTGTLTIEPEGTDFSRDLTFDDDWNFGSTLTGLTFGKLNNDAFDLTFSSALTTNGDLNFFAKNVTLDSNNLTTGSGNITLTTETLFWDVTPTTGSIWDTTGSVTVQPHTTTSPFQYFDTLWLQFTSTVSGLTIGRDGNFNEVITIDKALNVAGDVNLYGDDILLEQAITTTGAGSVLLKASDNIIGTGGYDIATAGGDITLWSDADANGLGYISLSANSNVISNGGDITLSGGADLATDYAEGYSNSGVLIGNNSTINSNGGDILVRGHSNISGDSSSGIDVSADVDILSGTGAISLYGRTNNTNAYGINVGTSTGGGIRIESAKTSGNAIVIDGYSSTSYGAAFRFNANKQVLATGGGDISIKGVATTNAGIFLSNIDILANTGTITLDGGAGGISSSGPSPGVILGYKAASTITSSSSDINIIGDSMNFGSYTKIQSSGALDIQGLTSSTTVGLAGGAGALNLDATELGYIQDGFSSITIGNSAAGLLTANTFTYSDNLTLQSGNGGINFAGALSVGANDLTLNSSGDITQSSEIIAAGLEFLGGGNVTLTNINNNVAMLAADTGSINYVDSNALTVGTVNTVGLTSTGTVSILTESGDLSLNANVATSDTSSSAVILHAGRASAAGTATGGNILINGSPSITVGAGGRATLFTGDIAASTGVTDFIISGSGRFRYNSDESATNYTSGLSTGNYVVYREQPTLTINAEDATLTYGTTPTLAASLSVQNGDTASQALSTAASVAVSGSTSTSGNFTVGSKTLTASGAVDQLGYSIDYTTGTLTVNQKSLTASYTGNNKTYDGLLGLCHIE